MDDQNTPSTEPTLAPSESESSQSYSTTPTDLPSEALESPINAPTPIPVEDQNEGVNTAEGNTSVQTDGVSISEPIQSQSAPAPESATTPQTPIAPQPQLSAQFDQTGFIHGLLIKAQAKIQFNKHKKLEKIMVLAQKKKVITNDDVQKLLYVSDATATRYLVKLVAQGRLVRAGNRHDAKYQFVR